MKIFFSFVIIFFFFYEQSNAQYHLTVFGGISNYQGDLQPKRFTFQQSHSAFGIGIEYEINKLFLVRTQASFGKISADDKLYKQNAERNLNFTSNIQELQLVGEFLFRDLDDYRFTPFLFGGLAIFHFNPYTHDTVGGKYFLQPLSTEGQGFVPGRKPYGLTQLSLPFGGGIKINLSNNIVIGFELGFRKTFTDYLDDVSTSYVNQNLLLTNRGPKAVELAFRGGELKSRPPYPPDGTLRGNSSKKDLYYFAGTTLTFKFGSSGIKSGFSNKNSFACPINSGL